jgi:CheY-like chemotaxis protein
MNNQSSGNKPLVLLVEDEQDTAGLVKLIMEGKGYQVLHAAEGSEALEKIALMPPPSLILLDIQLPGVDGVTLLEMIRATPDWQNVPVIMLTAISEEQRIHKVLSLNVQGYVLKPFKQETLVSCIEQARTRLARPGGDHG